MRVNYSSGLNILLANDTGLKTVFENGAMYTFPGVMPISGDVGITATPLGMITLNGDPWVAGSPDNGINVADAAVVNDVVLQLKEASELWQLNAVSSGTPGFVRWVGNQADDITQSSLIHPRMDILVTQSGGILNIRATTLLAGSKYTVDSFELEYAKGIA